jgi:hypothetical protein
MSSIQKCKARSSCSRLINRPNSFFNLVQFPISEKRDRERLDMRISQISRIVVAAELRGSLRETGFPL